MNDQFLQILSDFIIFRLQRQSFRFDHSGLISVTLTLTIVASENQAIDQVTSQAQVYIHLNSTHSTPCLSSSVTTPSKLLGLTGVFSNKHLFLNQIYILYGTSFLYITVWS